MRTEEPRYAARALRTGNRVFLRRPTPADAEAFIEMARRSRRLHRPWVYLSDDPTVFERYLDRIGSDRHAGFLACRCSDGAIVGLVNLSEIVRGGLQGAYMGFFASADHAGEGYMTEAVSLALDYAFRELRLHRIEANIQPGNTRSRALAKRCGFRHEGLSRRYLKIGGRWRDHQRWAILAEEWKVARRLPGLRLAGPAAGSPVDSSLLDGGIRPPQARKSQ